MKRQVLLQNLNNTHLQMGSAVIDLRYKSNLSPREICQSLTQIFQIMNYFCIFAIDFNMFTCADVCQKLNAVKALPGNFQGEFPGFQLIHDPE